MQQLAKRNIFALMTAHCAGMIDLVVLPIWIGVLVAYYHFDFKSAGLLVTLFLGGVTCASYISSFLLNRVNIKVFIVGGYFIASILFFICFSQSSLHSLSLLHFFAGGCVGLALSFTHGIVGKNTNPHRLFALLGMSLGIFSIFFMAATSHIIQSFGGNILFVILAIVMASAAIINAIFFPEKKNLGLTKTLILQNKSKLTVQVWLIILGISLLSMTQALTISFFERVGSFRGFSAEQISGSLIVYTVICLIPAPLAAFLQNRINKYWVICVGPVLQGCAALGIYFTSNYLCFTLFGACMAFTILFIHTFAFGLLAELDPSARAVSMTPAMLMSGSALGPIIGGVLIQYYGFEAIGLAATVLVCVQLVLFNFSRAKAVKKNKLINQFS